MGNIFEHLDDLDVVKRLMGNNCKFVEYGSDEDIIENQVGKPIIIDNVFELIPYNIQVAFPSLSILSPEMRTVVKWHLTAYHTIPSCRWDEPDCVEDVEMGTDLDIHAAILMIITEINKWDIDGHLENMGIENMTIEEKLHPEETITG